MPDPAVTELRLTPDKRCLKVSFDSDEQFELPAELLRVESPSAEVQGHDPSEKRIVGGKRGVAITAIEPVGHYAVRLIFDDGHDTGLFSWPVLLKLGREADALWATYEKALEERGLSR